MRNHYEVLGVARTAEASEIRQAHRRLVHALHPDRHLASSESERTLVERRMREINQAWYVLSDEQRRIDYDLSFADVGDPALGPGHNGSAGGSTRSATGSYARAATGNGASARARSASGSAMSGAGSRDGSPRRVSPDPGVPGYAALLLRIGPWGAVAVIAVALILLSVFVVSGSGDDQIREVSGNAPCVLLVEGSNGRYIDCSLPNDGQVVAEVEAALDCPTGTRYALVDTQFVCLPLFGD